MLLALYRTEGIVLRTRNLGEADKIVTLLTKDEGKIRAAASGARRMRSRLLALCQPFVHGKFLLFRGKNLDRLSQGELLNPYRVLREDLSTMALAAYFAELVDVFLEERDPHEDLFLLLANTFTWLADMGPSTTLARYFELHLLSYTGYRPQLDRCVGCGAPGEGFSVERGGMVCSACQPSGVPLLSPGTWEMLRQLARGRLRIVGILKPSESISREMEGVLSSYISFHGQRPIKSVDFLRSIGGG
ncbi:MAG: DNA repair protein RecO [Limnochordia bacterium]|jgi:DNA repair protein RecO (recombination protein O)